MSFLYDKGVSDLAFIVFLVYTPVNDCVLCVFACISSVVSRADMYFHWVKVI